MLSNPLFLSGAIQSRGFDAASVAQVSATVREA